MDLSIVIVNWNSVAWLAQALRSVIGRTGGLRCEIVVIDSGSFDGCAEMLSRDFPQVSFLQAPTNIGFARANNEACASTVGKVLLFLNPDAEPRAGAVQALHAALLADPGAAIAGPTLLNSDGSLQATCVRAFPTLLNQLLDAEGLQARFPRARLWGRRALADGAVEPCAVEAVSGACLMIKRDAFERVGGFSTDYFMYAEDMDLCLKAGRAGYRTLYVPAAVAVHHGGASSGQAPVSDFAAVMAVESQWRYFRKMHSAAHAAVYRAAMAGASVLRLGLLLLAWPLHRRGAGSLRPAWRKWSARLAWALGGRPRVRHLGRSGP